MTLTFADLTESWIELPIQAEAQQFCQTYATAWSRWNAYMNRLCLNAILPWLTAEQEAEVAIANSPSLTGLWHFINGSEIRIGQQKCILIPTEKIDTDELEVPQEWVDIPNLAGNYYVAIQMHLTEPSNESLDESIHESIHELNRESPDASIDLKSIKVLGYVTHTKLKTLARYDADDRTYNLNTDYLTTDLNALWLTQQLCPQAQTQASIAPLAPLPDAQAENLIARLVNPSIALTRLAIPFELWGALLENAHWRSQLCQRLSQATTSAPQSPFSDRPRINLGQWLGQQIETGWRSLETLLDGQATNLALSWRSVTDIRDPSAIRGKVVEWRSQPSVFLFLGLFTEADDRIVITVQVHPTLGQDYVPFGITLSLISDTHEVLQTVHSTEQDHFIQLRRFRCPPGTEFSLRLSLADESIEEDFIV